MVATAAGVRCPFATSLGEKEAGSASAGVIFFIANHLLFA
jgi:hypothetical protein